MIYTNRILDIIQEYENDVMFSLEANHVSYVISYDELNKLKNKLISIGITNLNITFDTQPLLLNKEIFELDDFINEQIKKGLEINEIAVFNTIDELDINELDKGKDDSLKEFDITKPSKKGYTKIDNKKGDVDLNIGYKKYL